MMKSCFLLSNSASSVIYKKYNLYLYVQYQVKRKRFSLHLRLHYGSYNDVQPKEKKKSKKYTPETWENNNDQSISRQQIMIQQIHLLFEGSFPTKLCFLNKYSKMT